MIFEYTGKCIEEVYKDENIKKLSFGRKTLDFVVCENLKSGSLNELKPGKVYKLKLELKVRATPIPGNLSSYYYANEVYLLDIEEIEEGGEFNNLIDNSGERAKILTELAVKYIRRGLDGWELREMIHKHNMVKCDPPLSPKEVERIIDSSINTIELYSQTENERG